MPNEIILEKLMNEYGTCILRTCFLYTRDYHLAQDATQETFLKALNAYNNLKNTESEKAWLTKIAINCCKNIMRTSWYKYVTPDDNILERQHTMNPINDMIEHNSLAEAVMLLNRNDRQLIILYYYQGLSIKEISKITKKKENTIAQQIRRARKKLKQILEDDDNEPSQYERNP
ncbi:sigma-70 family RNA polymerase sigma factor [Roseburia hominis]